MQCVLDIIRQKMLSTNVLCMKKRKKRSYYISEASDYIPRPSKDKRSLGSNTAMMQITEDTPPDMLTGAMDLTIHLPNSRTVKMSVERSTPMMDLLVQITTAYQLQHSGHILQALEMGSGSGPNDKILPYKPNTPIGSMDTQHVKVVTKNRTNSIPKTSAIGHQPFESTFRLQVHLPRNQLYVIRVSQFVYLEDIMKKVCDEKNLDIRKYEFRHPGHLDEVLDPKLTLSDYQITEVYLVAKGTVGLSQAFSSSDIMVLKKEEERKQLQSRTGGGVFNLIFKRGKPSFGSGSVSSDTRSISPSHSDDSRSVTPPGIPQQILPVTQQPSPITEKPKPPQRKRRPAPKPPQQNLPDSKPSSQVSTISDSNTSELPHKSTENGLTICHSRNSSDSSGYHEPSVLSDNCNLSLPRRTKANIITEVVNEESQSPESNKGSGNLSNMVKFSKSTTSIASRKKKAAPPPPPLLHSQSLVANEKPSPVVASPIVEVQGECNPRTLSECDNKCTAESITVEGVPIVPIEAGLDSLTSDSVISVEQASTPDVENDEKIYPIPVPRTKLKKQLSTLKNESKPVELDKPISQAQKNTQLDINKDISTLSYNNEVPRDKELIPINNNDTDTTNKLLVPNGSEKRVAPQVVAIIPKGPQSCDRPYDDSFPFRSISSRRKLNTRISLLSLNDMFTNSTDSKRMQNSISESHIPNLLDDYEVNNFNVDIFNTNKKPPLLRQTKISQERHGIYDLGFNTDGNPSTPNFTDAPGIRRWNNVQDLDDISTNSFLGENRWVVGGDSDTDSLSTVQTIPTKGSAPESISSKESTPSHFTKQQTFPNHIISEQKENPKSSLEISSNISDFNPTFENTNKFEYPKTNFVEQEPELENEWQYQLPSPPTAFRDLSPTNLTDVTNYDTVTLAEFKGESVITNPMLFEKLERVKDHQSEIETVSDITSNLSEEEKPMLNKLTLENLEKRKSLVYNRELSTSLKIAQDNDVGNMITTRSEERVNNSHSNVINELEDIIHNGRGKPLSRHNSCADDFKSTYDKHLPNFQISTYDKPKSKINIFEDDSVRSNVENPVKDEMSNKVDENSSFYARQNSDSSSVDENTFKKPQEFGKYKVLTRNNFYVKNQSATTNVIRSESFSSSNHNVYKWKPQNPVQRSKSQVALNHYKEDKHATEDRGESLSKSNSLFDVSGLQSLEVMRLIQTKLGSTPTNSVEHLLEEEKKEVAVDVSPPSIEEDKPDSTTKTYRYQGPPAINLSTWSERPKTKVSLKEDKDYRSNGTVSTNGVLVNNEKLGNSNNVSIKINGMEPIKCNHPGNVVIKIGETDSKSNAFSSRFINHTTAAGYRKPLSNISKIANIGRPHSLDLDIDISRVPVVRSVELKKPFKEVVQINNKSVTQINTNNNELVNNIRNKYIEEIPESPRSVNSTNNDCYTNGETKPVSQLNSFAQSRYGPTVIGFRNFDVGNDNTAKSRKSWNVSSNYGTLPTKVSSDYTTKTNNYTPNSNVPFSQVTLRRVESNKVLNGEVGVNSNGHFVTTDTPLNTKLTTYTRYSTGGSDFGVPKATKINSTAAPPPPAMPKITNIKKKVVKTFEPVRDPRDDLLNSIRNFGGVKGLKHAKV